MKTLNVGETVEFVIEAKHEYSIEKVSVKENQKYTISCDQDQQWKDWGRVSRADGFNNWAARIVGLRVKGVKCFCLCGCFEDDAKKGFEIGFGRGVTVPQGASTMSFFANDSRGFYWNNSGAVKILIARNE